MQNLEKKLNDFLEKKSALAKLIVVYWPTACGKTSLGIEIAKIIVSEVISADSRQVYRWLDIWTWKVTRDEMIWIPHQMIDILDLDSSYSVEEYKTEAEKNISKLHESWKIPVLCGWTGLYIDSIIFNFNLPKVEPDWDLRNKLEEIRLEKWNDFLWEILNEKDPDYAKNLSPNNYRYVIRWIEVFEKTSKSKQDLWAKNEPKYDILFFTPYDGNREKLYEKINNRVDKMFNDWLINEVKNLTKKYAKDSFGLNTIWYKEITLYLDWKISLMEATNLIKQHNRNYAKRQLTWFRKYEN